MAAVVDRTVAAIAGDQCEAEDYGVEHEGFEVTEHQIYEMGRGPGRARHSPERFEKLFRRVGLCVHQAHGEHVSGGNALYDLRS